MENEDKNYGLYLKFILRLSNNKLKNFSYKEQKGNKKFEFFINEEMYLVLTKDNNFIQVQNQSEVKTNKGEKLLFEIKKDGNSYKLFNPIPGKDYPSLLPISENIEILDNHLWWYVLNSEDENIIYKENDDYYLNENDIIKMADIIYIVKKINISSKSYENLNISNPKYDIQRINKKANNVFEYKVSEYQKCKFYDGYKVKLCKCENQLIETKCIKKMFSSQNNKLEDKGKKYNIELIKCPICQTYFPIQITINSKKIDLYEIKIDEKWKNEDYIELERFQKCIYYIKLGQGKIEIGKDFMEGNDIKEKSELISKHHAVISNKNGKILIRNNEGALGTLILIKDNYLPITENKIQFQIGKVFIQACMIKKSDLIQKKDYSIPNREQYQKNKEIKEKKEKEEKEENSSKNSNQDEDSYFDQCKNDSW